MRYCLALDLKDDEKLIHEYDWLAEDSVLKDDPTYLEKITVYIGLRHLWLAMGTPYGPPPRKSVTKRLTEQQQLIFDAYRQKILNNEGDVDQLSDEAIAKMEALGPLWGVE